MSDITIVFAIIAGVIILFMLDRLPVIAVCMGAALSLWVTGVLTLPQSLAGFGDPATIFVASLFVVSAGLEAAGVTAWAGKLLIDGAGESRVRLMVFMMLLVGVLSALISVNGAVAALLPVVVVMAIRLRRAPSTMLMPLVFGAHAGSMLALTGTPVNVLVLEASAGAGGGGFGYFEFALAGVPLVAGSILIAIFLGPRLLPVRETANLPPDLTAHARTLTEEFLLTDDVIQLRVRAESPLVGTLRRQLALTVDGVALVTVRSGAGTDAGPTHAIEAGDVLVVRGSAQDVGAVASRLALVPHDEEGDVAELLFNRRSGLAEIVIPPRSSFVGRQVFPGMVTDSGDLVVLAVKRAGEPLAAGGELAVGDTLLLQGTWEALERRLGTTDVLVVNSPELVRRQAVPLGRGAARMLVILGAMVLLLATGVVPAAVAGLLAAGAVLLTGILRVDEVYRAVNWTTVILVGAMMPLSTAIAETGAAELVADGLVAMAGEAGPLALVAGLFVVTAILGQVISNTATALIIIPIAVVAAGEMGVSPQPVLMAVAVAAAAALLTPVATPTNLMVMEPAGYRFGDYWKFGLPLMVWYFVVAVGIVPLIWPF